MMVTFSSFVKRGVVLGGIVLLGGLWWLSSQLVPSQRDELPTHMITLTSIWQLEIADEQEEQALGLGGRDTLPHGRGMLFTFSEPGYPHFWMKGMRFPIDIVFLDGREVVLVERNIHPSDTRIFSPPIRVDRVLEVNAGDAAHLESGNKIWYWYGLAKE